jgi:ubiquinol-cytochrome c reductase iron-sulfur subunit
MVQPSSPPNPGRRKFLTNFTGFLGAIGAFFVAIPFLSAFKPSARAEAAGAPVQVDISSINPGEMMIVEWRGTPIYVVKHSEESLDKIDMNLERLADPDSEIEAQPIYAKNKYRSRKMGISVLSAVCTHLGCAPKYYPQLGVVDFDSEWQGGFFLSMSWL